MKPSPFPNDRKKRTRPQRETILLVEDDPFLRDVLRQFLETSGYTVLESDNAWDALRLGDENASEIDLVVSDVLESVDGIEWAARLGRLRPYMPVLMMSGNHGFPDPDLKPADAAFLAKPFTPKVLLGKIKEVMARPFR